MPKLFVDGYYYIQWPLNGKVDVERCAYNMYVYANAIGDTWRRLHCERFVEGFGASPKGLAGMTLIQVGG